MLRGRNSCDPQGWGLARGRSPYWHGGAAPTGTGAQPLQNMNFLGRGNAQGWGLARGRSPYKT